MENHLMFKMTREGCLEAIKFLRTEMQMKHESLFYMDGFSLVALANHEWNKLYGT